MMIEIITDGIPCMMKSEGGNANIDTFIHLFLSSDNASVFNNPNNSAHSPKLHLPFLIECNDLFIQKVE